MVSTPEKENLLFTCLAPESSKLYGEQAIDFGRKNAAAMFCHLRFSRPMIEGDNVEVKLTFHDFPLADGQCLISVTPTHLLELKAKEIVKESPYLIDPTKSWISHLKDEDYRRSLRFGIMYKNESIQLRLPGETTFFPFYHVSKDSGPIWIDFFFCDHVKSLSLRVPLFPKCPDVVYDVEEDDFYNDPTLIDYIIVQQKATIVTV